MGTMRKFRIKINGYDDRRKVSSILADNGISVKIEQVQYGPLDYSSFIELEGELLEATDGK